MTAGTARALRADLVMAASILLLGLFLCLTGKGLLEQWQRSAARGQGADVDDLLGAVAVVAGLAIVAWWTFSMVLASAAALLERCGRLRAAERAGRFSPAFMRRLAVAALSLQLLSAPLAHADTPPAGPAWVPTQEAAIEQVTTHQVTTPVVATPQVTTDELTTDEVASQNAAIPVHWTPTASEANATETRPSDIPDTGRPNTEPPNTESPTTEPPDTELPTTEPPTVTQKTEAPQPKVRPDWRPSAPVAEPGLMAAQPLRAAQDPPPPSGEVTVLAGDTLWDIASRQLGPNASDVDVALHWPRWYDANKAQIGENPHVLLPGQILKAPSTA